MVYYIYTEYYDKKHGDWYQTGGVHRNSRSVPAFYMRTISAVDIPFDVLKEKDYGLCIPNEMSYLALGGYKSKVYACSAQKVIAMDSSENIISYCV